MQARLDFMKAVPDAVKAAVGLETYIQKCGLERRLIHLVKLRASQINGCAYCVDMHVKEARHDGLSEQWINLLCVWRESPIYDARERALLAWTEALTLLPQTGAPDADYAAMRAHFSDEDIVKLSLAIGTINVWNRMAVGFRSQHPVEALPKAA